MRVFSQRIGESCSEHDERVDKNLWRFLLATFGLLVTLLIGLLSFTVSGYLAMVKEGNAADRRQDITIAQMREQSQSAQQDIMAQMQRQQQAMSALTQTVAALHDEVLRNTVYREGKTGARK